MITLIYSDSSDRSDHSDGSDCVWGGGERARGRCLRMCRRRPLGVVCRHSDPRLAERCAVVLVTAYPPLAGGAVTDGAVLAVRASVTIEALLRIVYEVCLTLVLYGTHGE